MKLDARGYITPYWNVAATVEEMRAAFVVGKSETRERLFEAWMDYNKKLVSILGQDFVQWVNGSFIGPKENPGDIDVVSFIPADIHRQKAQALAPFKGLIALKNHRIDGYFVDIPDSEGHAQQILQADRSYWIDWFSKVKSSSSKKGFLEINITQKLYLPHETAG